VPSRRNSTPAGPPAACAWHSPTEPDHQEAGKYLGADPFERNTRAVSLTAARLSFLPHARNTLEELDLARRAATTESGTFYGRLGVGFSGALNLLHNGSLALSFAGPPVGVPSLAASRIGIEPSAASSAARIR
jgi:hypothetical protein